MKVHPVKRYTPPKYPTLTSVAGKPELLKVLPLRWQKNMTVLTAIGLIGVISLSSCVAKNIGSGGDGLESDSYLNVAPIFEHGIGTGSIGCDMVVPPVFLSEEEALAVICAEAEKYGVKLDDTPPSYTATQNIFDDENQYSWLRQKYKIGDGSVELDLYDKKNKTAVSYISMEQAAVTGLDDTVRSSVTSYQPKDLAELSVEDFASQTGDINVGIFYDPGRTFDINDEAYTEYQDAQNGLHEEYSRYYDSFNYDGEPTEKQQEYYDKSEAILKEYETKSKESILEDLKSQIADFFEWLQGQGII